MTLALLIMLAMAIGVLVGAWLRPSPTLPERVLRRFTITLDKPAWQAAISPDGRHIAYVGGTNPRSLWIYDFSQARSRHIEDTEEAIDAFWSPDSTFVGLGTLTDLRKVAVADGAVSTLCTLPHTPLHPFFSGTWSRDGSAILMTPTWLGHIMEVSALGGEPKTLAQQPESDRHEGWSGICALPSVGRNRAVLCTFGTQDECEILVRDLETGEQRILGRGSRPAYSQIGHVLYQSEPGSSTIMALPLSAGDWSPIGEAFPVAERAWSPSIARDGTLVYLGGSAPMQQLTWVDRQGRRLGRIGLPQEQMSRPALSPDGRFVAVRASEDKALDIWIHDIDRSVKSLLSTDNPWMDNRPVWSPDGKYVAYTAVRSETSFDFVRRRADGTGEVEPVVVTVRLEQPCDWSADDEYILFQQGTGAEGRALDILHLRRQRDGSYGDPKPCLATTASERVAKLSPDVRYIAYCSNESGIDEVYVQRFPDGGEKTQISTGGGTQPRWSRDGEELFFVQGDQLMAVDVATASRFAVGPPKLLFRHPGLLSGVPEQMYDVSADGERFVVVENVAPEDGLPAIHVVENWYKEFRSKEEE